MMDELILRIARKEARVAAVIRAFGGWWFDRAVGRGLRALARKGQKSGHQSRDEGGRG